MAPQSKEQNAKNQTTFWTILRQYTGTTFAYYNHEHNIAMGKNALVVFSQLKSTRITVIMDLARKFPVRDT